VERLSKVAGREQAGTIPLWYRRQFNLPANDPRYLDLTIGEILTEYWSQHYDDLHRAGKLEDDFENPDFDEDFERFMNGDDGDWEEV
jgi:hypothetical protein